MSLKSSKTVGEVLENTNKKSESDLSNAYITKDDMSNFTINKWRNKIFTDIRVRSKLKDRNYRTKLIEDLELTRNASLKILQKHCHLIFLDNPISVGSNAVIFQGEIPPSSPLNRGYYNYKVAIKVWNKPSKQLIESKKDLYENDIEFMEKLNKASSSEFHSLWIDREITFYNKLKKAGINCPEVVTSHKNMLITKFCYDASLEEAVERLKKDPDLVSRYDNVSRYFRPVFNTMRIMYQNSGLVSVDLNEKNVSKSGTIYDVSQIISKSDPRADEILFKNCSRILNYCKEGDSLGNLNDMSSQKMFSEITGFEFKDKSTIQSPYATNNLELNTRKIERKSERSKKNIDS